MSTTRSSPTSRRRTPAAASWWNTIRLALIGVMRLLGPGARGVYHPQPDSPIILGAVLPPDADLDDLQCRLWWRGLGITERDGTLIAGADVATAARQRRMRSARAFVTRQLRDAGVRGPIKRWPRSP